MGKFDKLTKFLGLAPTEYADDAAKLLEKVDTPELATSLKGDVREEYLKILDEIYGPKYKRGKDFSKLSFKEYADAVGSDKIKQLIKDGYDIRRLEKSNLSGNYLTYPSYDITKDGKVVGGTAFDYINPKDLKTLNVAGITSVDSAHRRKGLASAMYEYARSNSSNFIGGTKKIIPSSNLTEYGSALWDSGKLDDLSNSEKIVPTFKRGEVYRSADAAFDPRFKNSPLLMAGAAAVPIDMNPIGDIKKGLGYYEQAKEAITKPLAQQLNIGKNPQDEKAFNSILKTGLDPVNYVPGAAGAGLGAIQMLTPSDEEIQQQALQRLIDENR